MSRVMRWFENSSATPPPPPALILCLGPNFPAPTRSTFNQETVMAKGQQKSSKEAKKPKKDTSPPKSVSPDAVRPTITTVVPVRGKLKK